MIRLRQYEAFFVNRGGPLTYLQYSCRELIIHEYFAPHTNKAQSLLMGWVGSGENEDPDVTLSYADVVTLLCHNSLFAVGATREDVTDWWSGRLQYEGVFEKPASIPPNHRRTQGYLTEHGNCCFLYTPYPLGRVRVQVFPESSLPRKIDNYMKLNEIPDVFAVVFSRRWKQFIDSREEDLTWDPNHPEDKEAYR